MRKTTQPLKCDPAKDLDKDAQLIELLNEMLAYIPRISYNIFNQFYETTNRKGLERLEKAYPELGLAYQNIHTGVGTFDRNEDKLGVSTISIIATITDMLYGKRLAVLIDEEGYITGFQWYQPDEEWEGKDPEEQVINVDESKEPKKDDYLVKDDTQHPVATMPNMAYKSPEDILGDAAEDEIERLSKKGLRTRPRDEVDVAMDEALSEAEDSKKGRKHEGDNAAN